MGRDAGARGVGNVYVRRARRQDDADTSFFNTLEERDGVIASGMEAGANESADRLEELLASLQA
jgi:hypothetical protein